jgi:hypothetical protein
MFTKKYFKVLGVFIFLLYNCAVAQKENSGTLKGKVIDKTVKHAIEFATIIIKGTTQGTSADTTGNFVINNLNEGVYSIVVSFVGYQEKTINDVRIIRNKTNYIEIELEVSSTSLNEVTVTAYKYENSPLTPVSAYSFSREEISRNPGAQGDIFRAIGMLPGVSSSGGAYSAIAVRGQSTRDNVYMVDDMPLTDLGHLEGQNGFSDPNGPRFSIFAPRVIDNAQFQGGGFAAQYGKKSSSFLALGIKEGNVESPIIDGQLDLLGATVNYDGPSYVFKNTSIFASARMQNLGPVLELVGQGNLGNPKYQDFIFKSTTSLGTKNKLSVIGLYNPEKFTREVANIRLDEKLNELFIANVKKSKSLVGLNLRTLTGKNSYLRNVLYFTNSNFDENYGNSFPKTDASGLLIPESTISVEEKIRTLNYDQSRIGYRSIYKAILNAGHTLAIGVDADLMMLNNERKLNRPDTLYVYRKGDYRPDPLVYYSVISPMNFNASYNKSAVNASAYVDYSFLAFNILTLNTGLRYDYNGFNKQNMLSPRISGSLQLNETNSLNFATGIFYQDPAFNEIADQPEGNVLKNERTIQIIAGYKKHFSPSLKFTVEAWYKVFDDLVVRPVSGYSILNNNGDGWASGIDFNITKRLTDKIHGQLGYSRMESKRNNNDGLGEYDYSFSQPDQFNFLLSYKPNKHLVLSTKFRYATGQPTDKYTINSNIFNNQDKMRYSMEVIGRNQERLPDFISLDIRADYRFQIKQVGLTAFLDIVDINNRLNPNVRSFNSITGTVYYSGIEMFPTFGLKFEF